MISRRRSQVIKALLILSATWIAVTYIIAVNSNNSSDLLDKSSEQKHKAERSLQEQPIHISGHGDHSEKKEAEYHGGDQDNSGVLRPPREMDGPGEMGKPVKVSNLTEDQEKLVKLGWKNNAFNQYVSDMISIHRTLPDPRDKE